MLGYLGAATIKLKTSHQNFLSQFRNHWFMDSFAFCYLKKDNKLGIKDDPLKPYSLINFVEFLNDAAFILQSTDNTTGFGSTEGNKIIDQIERLPEYSKYFTLESVEQGYFVRSLRDFMDNIDSVYISTYRSDQTNRHHSSELSAKDLESNKFEVVIAYSIGTLHIF